MQDYNRFHLRQYIHPYDELISDEWHKLFEHAKQKEWLESDFSQELSDEQFHQNFWELYVANHLEGNGIKIKKLKTKAQEECPDFYFEKDGQKFWIEAIAVNKGTGKDKVPEAKFTEITSDTEDEDLDFQEVPTKQAELRMTCGLQTKLDAYNRYLKSGTITKNDFFIIALNYFLASDTWLDISDSGRPYLISALYNLGPQMIGYNNKTKEVSYWTAHRIELKKANGASVPLNYFNNEDNGNFIGAIGSDCSFQDLATRPYHKIYYNINPLHQDIMPFEHKVFDYVFFKEEFPSGNYRVSDINGAFKR